jgi:hypothetical protein
MPATHKQAIYRIDELHSNGLQNYALANDPAVMIHEAATAHAESNGLAVLVRRIADDKLVYYIPRTVDWADWEYPSAATTEAAVFAKYGINATEVTR